jgi:hypothetical protein
VVPQPASAGVPRHRGSARTDRLRPPPAPSLTLAPSRAVTAVWRPRRVKTPLRAFQRACPESRLRRLPQDRRSRIGPTRSTPRNGSTQICVERHQFPTPARSCIT